MGNIAIPSHLIPDDPTELYSLNTVKNVLRGLNFHTSKWLGQNFLYRQPTIEACLDSTGIQTGQTVLEIGPGLGHLTFALLSRSCRVLAIEIDPILGAYVKSFIHTHQKKLGGLFTLLEGDVLKASWEHVYALLQTLIPDRSSIDIHVIANLPYRIAVPVLARFLESTLPITDFHILVQAEVAERLAAKPREKEYGKVSVFAQALCTISILRQVSPANFHPQPKVNSAWLRLVPRPDVNREIITQWLKPLVYTAFAKRRKCLKRLGKEWHPPSHASLTTEQIKSAIEEWGQARPEELSVENWIQVAQHLADMNTAIP